MKKLLLILPLLVVIAAMACDKQAALDKILADPEAGSYILGQMLANENTRAELADSIFADQDIIEVYVDGLVENENSRADLLSRMIAVDTTGEWITTKLAEDPAIKEAMRKASRR